MGKMSFPFSDFFFLVPYKLDILISFWNRYKVPFLVGLINLLLFLFLGVRISDFFGLRLYV